MNVYDHESFILIDDAQHPGAGSLLFERAVDEIVARSASDVPGAFEQLETALARGQYAAGFFSYELAFVLESALAPRLPEGRVVPLLWFGVFDTAERLSAGDVDAWLAGRSRATPHWLSHLRLDWNEEAYRSRFARAQEHIRAGDVYQLNLAFKARFRFTGSPFSFYRAIRRQQRVACGGVIETGCCTVLSVSPELFLEKHGSQLLTRPMKGTAPRWGPPDTDDEARRFLSHDEKSRAENVMIVDLMRNDLGRIAETGSVRVTDLFTVETWPTVHQLTSGIRATAREGLTIKSLFDAIFPPGSVTGAPKIRAVQLLQDLETGARGVYCGSMGFFSPDGHARFNVAIRTPVLFPDGTGELGIGSGVVFDSNAEAEYEECLLKMQFLTQASEPFGLIETLLYEPIAGFSFLEEHLRRLAASAAWFGIPCDLDVARNVLFARVEERGTVRQRVRLHLGEDGAFTVTALELGTPPSPLRYVVSSTPMFSANPFLLHKTVRRDVYDHEWRHYSSVAGIDEVLYVNERGELTEGSRTSVFLQRGGRLVTPALGCGLLPGVLRAHLLSTGQAEEAVLTLDDLRQAEAVYVGNSVRGLLRARPCDEASRERAERGLMDTSHHRRPD